MRQHRHAESGEPQHQVPQHGHTWPYRLASSSSARAAPSGAASQRESTPASTPDAGAAPACRSAAMVTKLTTTTDISVTAATPRA